jgi:hypothetical protein
MGQFKSQAAQFVPSWIKYSAYGTHEEYFAADVDDGNSGGRRDGAVAIEDLLYYLDQYDLGTAAADMSGDGGVDSEDLALFLGEYDDGLTVLDSRPRYAGYQYSARTQLYHVLTCLHFLSRPE